MKENEASSTAFTVLQGVLYIADHNIHSKLVSDDLKDASLKIILNSDEGKKRFNQLNSWWFRPIVPLVEKLIMPGITLHYVLRKRYIEEYTLKAIENGVKQVINLGAGFDTLAYRLSQKYKDVNFIEIDHPATHKIKRDALTNSGENLHFIPVDFTKQKLEDELGSSEYLKKDVSTLYILEGVIMYLNLEQIEHLFNSLPQIVDDETTIIFTAVEPSSNSTTSYGPLLKLYLKIKDEPLNWNCSKDSMDEFLSTVDYKLLEIAGANEFRDTYLDSKFSGDVHDGEYIAVAQYSNKSV